MSGYFFGAIDFSSLLIALAELNEKTNFICGFEGVVYHDFSYKGTIKFGGIDTKIDPTKLDWPRLGAMPKLKFKGSEEKYSSDKMWPIVLAYFEKKISATELERQWNEM